MNFTLEKNPQIRRLAREAAQEIKALSNAHNTQIEGIYRRFLAQAAAIRAEASTDSYCDSSGADSLPTTQANESIGTEPIMTRTISTSAKALGYYVTLPSHIEDALGSYFENLTKPEQYTLLATLTSYLGYQIRLGHDLEFTIWDAYTCTTGEIENEAIELLLPELGAIEVRCNGTLECLIEALVANIRTGVVMEE
jgi:hypothetical protein